MKSIMRKPAASAIGLAALLFFSFAALAQTPSGSAAKQVDLASSVYERLSNRLFVPRPRSCFCDEDCFAALQKKQRFNSMPRWRPLYPLAENEIQVIDFDGLKKLLEREPKDTRPLLINFWATWCDGCREEFPDLVRIDNDYRSKGLNFLSITVDEVEDKGKAAEFLKEMKATMPVVLLNVADKEPAIHAVDATWDGALPATFLYDREGKVVFKYFGKIKPAELRAVIDKEVGSKQQQ